VQEVATCQLLLCTLIRERADKLLRFCIVFTSDGEWFRRGAC